MKEFWEFLQSGHTPVIVLVLGIVCFAIGAGIQVAISKDRGVESRANKPMLGLGVVLIALGLVLMLVPQPEHKLVTNAITSQDAALDTNELKPVVAALLASAIADENPTRLLLEATLPAAVKTGTTFDLKITSDHRILRWHVATLQTDGKWKSWDSNSANRVVIGTALPAQSRILILVSVLAGSAIDPESLRHLTTLSFQQP